MNNNTHFQYDKHMHTNRTQLLFSCLIPNHLEEILHCLVVLSPNFHEKQI